MKEGTSGRQAGMAGRNQESHPSGQRLEKEKKVGALGVERREAVIRALGRQAARGGRPSEAAGGLRR